MSDRSCEEPWRVARTHVQWEGVSSLGRALGGVPRVGALDKRVYGSWYVISFIDSVKDSGINLALYTVPRDSSYWVNFHAFLARLTTARIIDSSLLAMWAFRSSLEDPSAEDITRARISSNGLEAIAMWILYAGEALRAHSKNGLTYGDRVGIPGGEFKDTRDWRGFNEERWGIWLERLRLTVSAVGLQERTKVLVTECIESMEKL